MKAGICSKGTSSSAKSFTGNEDTPKPLHEPCSSARESALSDNGNQSRVTSAATVHEVNARTFSGENSLPVHDRPSRLWPSCHAVSPAKADGPWTCPFSAFRVLSRRSLGVGGSAFKQLVIYQHPKNKCQPMPTLAGGGGMPSNSKPKTRNSKRFMRRKPLPTNPSCTRSHSVAVGGICRQDAASTLLAGRRRSQVSAFRVEVVL